MNRYENWLIARLDQARSESHPAGRLLCATLAVVAETHRRRYAACRADNGVQEGIEVTNVLVPKGKMRSGYKDIIAKLRDIFCFDSLQGNGEAR